MQVYRTTCSLHSKFPITGHKTGSIHSRTKQVEIISSTKYLDNVFTLVSSFFAHFHNVKEKYTSKLKSLLTNKYVFIGCVNVTLVLKRN